MASVTVTSANTAEDLATPRTLTVSPGEAKIKAEFLIKVQQQQQQQVPQSEEEPELKKLKIDQDGDEATPTTETESTTNGESGGKGRKNKKQKGQNKNRPRPHKFINEEKLCSVYWDGKPEKECSYVPNCRFLHDVEKYLADRTDSVDGECFIFKTYGKCPRGLACVFANSHFDKESKRNIVNEELWLTKKDEFEKNHRHLLDKDTQNALRKHSYDFKDVEKIYSSNIEAKSSSVVPENKSSGAVTDADVIPLRVSEIKKIDWNDKLYLSPLTTVGNLPFRRLCVEMGADITCSEMSLATSVIQGNMAEFALHRRHPSEKIWGVQLCASNGVVCAKAAHVLNECGIDYDFVDLNTGCPLEPIYKQGAGSGLMCRTNKFQSIVKGMTKVLASQDRSFTVKMRTGLKVDKNIAQSFLEFCRDSGVAACTLHGRSREQRYLRLADWNYIGQCAKVIQPMPLFGNGDIMSWDDYQERKAISNCAGVMIGRGALIKPWVFQEIKEQRNIDMSSSERLELIRKYANYGLDHWGSDIQGVTTTRRFLLEWLSFFHRYIPHGVLEDPPQRINQRPPRYCGRDEMETLLASPYSADWIKISEMFLGPVGQYFEFVPKHKANAWSNG